jgi:hypothetical protein
MTFLDLGSAILSAVCGFTAALTLYLVLPFPKDPT